MGCVCREVASTCVAEGHSRFCVACSGDVRAALAMDLGNLDSVAAFADSFERQLHGAPLHTLVNNAGAIFVRDELP